MRPAIKKSIFEIGVVALFLVPAVGCGGGDDNPAGPDGNAQPTAATADSDQRGPCDLLTKSQVEDALGVGELSAVKDEEFDCAYGSQADEAQVTFSVGQLVGGSETFEESRAAFHESLGEGQVRDLEGIGEGAYVVDNGPGGGFFASGLGEGDRHISIYIYPAVKYDGGSTPIPGIDNEKLFQAAERMLTTAVPLL